MKTLKFKTNINCSGCVAAVTPHLNALQGITHWQVETPDPQKILTIETPTLNADQIIAAIAQAGYRAEKI